MLLREPMPVQPMPLLIDVQNSIPAKFILKITVMTKAANKKSNTCYR